MRRSLLFAPALVVTAVLIFAASGREGRSSLLAGPTDPVLGLDHFLVLVGVGLWAGKLGGAAPWRMPAAFLIGALLGFGLAAGQPPFPLAEALVHALVIGSILLIAAALIVPVALPLREAMSTVAMMGGCHGYIHAVHLGSHSAWWFSLGSLVTAGLLLGAGVAVGLAAPRVE